MVKVPTIQSKDVLFDIQLSLSGTKTCGRSLREAHYRLGKFLGAFIQQDMNILNNRVTVLILMRSGLMFGLGVADALEEKKKVNIHFLYEPNETVRIPETDKIVVVDGVINTGETMRLILDKLDFKDIMIACNVMSRNAVEVLEKENVYSIRISDHFFVGSNVNHISGQYGPDTGERLFNSSFYSDLDNID